MIDNTILIDQSYFLQDNSEVKSPEEKAEDFMKEFIKSKKDSKLLKELSIEDSSKILSEFLFESLNLYSLDPNELPTGEKLDIFIINSFVEKEDNKEEKQEDKQEEKEEGEGQEEISRGPEEVEDSMDEKGETEKVEERGDEDSRGSEGSGGDGDDNNEDGEPFSGNENEGGGTNNSGTPTEIQDGGSVTIRRSSSGSSNRFF